MLPKIIFVTFCMDQIFGIAMQNEFVQMTIYGQKLYPNAITLFNVFDTKLAEKFFTKKKHIQILDNVASKKLCCFEVKGSGELFLALTNNGNTESFIQIVRN